MLSAGYGLILIGWLPTFREVNKDRLFSVPSPPVTPMIKGAVSWAKAVFGHLLKKAMLVD